MNDEQIMQIARPHDHGSPREWSFTGPKLLAFARALLAAGASEGQAFDEWKKGYWFVDDPDEPNAESAAREAWNARDAEIAALRERIAGMEKEARDAERRGIDRALDVLAANFYWSAYERVRDLIDKEPK